MDVRVFPARLKGSIDAIASKSVAHRVIIAATLSSAPTRVCCNTSCDDIDATVSCLRALGARIEESPGEFFVYPLPYLNGEAPFCEFDKKPVVLNCRESGTTFRFLLPLVAALGVSAQFTGAPRLAERPIAPLAVALENAGVKLYGVGAFPLSCKGPFKSIEFSLPGNVSSQYISGLLFAASAQRIPLNLQVTGVLESASYITLTLDALRVFGADIRVETPASDPRRASSMQTACVFHHQGGALISPGTIQVEGDWSNAAFWLCAAALGEHPLRVCGLNPHSSQGDAAVLKVLQGFGAKVCQGKDWVEVSPDRLRAYSFSAQDIPDLIPVLSLVAARAQGITRISDCARLRLKECDRLQASCQALVSLGVKAWIKDECLMIEGTNCFKPCELSSMNDHRMAMMAAVAACVAEGPVLIKGAQAVEKSYPRFFADLQALGGRIEAGEEL